MDIILSLIAFLIIVLVLVLTYGSPGSNDMNISKLYATYAMLCYAKSLQSCPTLCNPMDGSPPGSPVLGILQARTLEWVAISFSNAWKWKVKVKPLSHIRLLATHGLQPTRLLCPWDFPGESTGVGCHCLLRMPCKEVIFQEGPASFSCQRKYSGISFSS